MEHTTALLRSTQLRDRRLWFDGNSSFDPHKLLRLVQHYDIKFVTEITDLVKEYNRFVPTHQQIAVKLECNPIEVDWNLPKEYKELNVVDYVVDRHLSMSSEWTSAEIEMREIRLSQELVRYQKYNFVDILRTIIYIINTLMANNIVWGIGRGSSVSSYVLYVIGVHDVDSFKYGLDIDDFLHE